MNQKNDSLIFMLSSRILGIREIIFIRPPSSAETKQQLVARIAGFAVQLCLACKSAP